MQGHKVNMMHKKSNKKKKKKREEKGVQKVKYQKEQKKGNGLKIKSGLNRSNLNRQIDRSVQI